MTTEEDKAYFLTIKDTLEPLLEKEIGLSFQNGAYRRFENPTDAAKYIITELTKDCYVYGRDDESLDCVDID